ncbi:MAG TPA: hypothetical protein VJK71_11040 [Gemmatimonadales bacterium]|nr:hypothetical protein [Gemmatimonadales bacterium]
MPSRAGPYCLTLRLVEGTEMRTNLTIFFLFFGLALLDAIRGGYWLRVAFWLGIGVFFFLADRRQLAKRRQ